MIVSIIVITARDDPGFINLAQSIQNSSYKEIQLVLVDRLKEQRGDSWALTCEQAGIDFLHIQDRNPAPGPCPSSARNLGISNSGGEYIICLDDLTSFEPTFIASHLARLQLGFDAVAGSCVEYDGSVQTQDSRLDDPYQDSGKWISDRYYGMHMAFTKSTWSAVGGFDESFDGAYGWEDCDFGRRVFRAGFSVGWFPELKIMCVKDSRHHLDKLHVGKSYKSDGLNRLKSDEPLTLIYGEEKWKNDKILLLNDKMQILDGGYE